jgi:hypothetical protein
MNVQIRTEAAQFPEKEYINGIFVAVPPTALTLARVKWNNFVILNSIAKYVLLLAGKKITKHSFVYFDVLTLRVHTEWRLPIPGVQPIYKPITITYKVAV